MNLAGPEAGQWKHIAAAPEAQTLRNYDLTRRSTKAEGVLYIDLFFTLDAARLELRHCSYLP